MSKKVETKWVYNEKGNIQALLETPQGPVLYELRPPTGGEVEDMGVWAYNNPGNQLGAMFMLASKCLVQPVTTLQQLRDADAVLAMEVAAGLKTFPVFANNRQN